MNWPGDFINKIICGDNLSVMKEMPDESVDMVITSPPYWGLRDYGFEQIFGGDPDCKHTWTTENVYHDNLRFRDPNKKASVGTDKNPKIFTDPKLKQGNCIYCGAWKGQLGLEPTPELYIEHLTEIFNEVKRILKKEGTFWLNIGDTYFGSGCGTNDYRTPANLSISKPKLYDGPRPQNIRKHPYLKPKSLCMIPERLAWSLIQNGWIQRNKIPWIKPNSMPSSAKDRYTNKWEYVFYFAKNQRNYFDLDSIREPHETEAIINKTKLRGLKSASPNIGQQQFHSANIEYSEKGKNPGDVWIIPTQPCPFKDVHFATFPEKLCEKAIIPGSPEQVCKKCGKARERITRSEKSEKTWNKVKPNKRGIKGGSYKWQPDPHRKERISPIGNYKNKTIGLTSCKCKAGFEGGIVLDPFCGVGTALYLAKELKRRFIGIDIKKEYCEMCEKRLAQGVL